ncbi:MAG: hypothetical protein ACOCUL_00690 [Bacteroidota bacterium]
MELGTLKIGSAEIELASARFFGIYENYGAMTWYIELTGKNDDKEIQQEENDEYESDAGNQTKIQLNALDLGDIYLPDKLTGIKLKVPGENQDEDENDLFFHAYDILGLERRPNSLNLSFLEYDPEKHTIRVEGSGELEKDEEENLPGESYQFNVTCEFRGINLVETSEEDINLFIKEKLQLNKNDLEIKLEESPAGLMCLVRFKPGS